MIILPTYNIMVQFKYIPSVMKDRVNQYSFLKHASTFVSEDCLALHLIVIIVSVEVFK